ncbi:cps2J protein [Liquorilactobacillus sucicola DSM 21376 = JCM 15457]|uniref:Cps2J protein n=2 Tax=Liquorilactobacillus sucicola TaxID=519050 RepID=A0A0R2DQM8_9LACO|nr:cps2J protein [Liquorilactobacillus sucicola DSM 21376 = JCM 15457]
MHVIMNAYRNIDRKRVQFDFACTTAAGATFEDEIAALGGKVYFLDQSKKMDLPYTYRFIKHLLLSQQYVALHYHATSPWGVGIRAAKKAGTPIIIMHSHNSMWGSTRIKGFRNYLFSIGLARKATVRLACSKNAGKTLFGKKEFLLLNNAIDTHKFKFDQLKRASTRKSLKIANDTLLLGQVGRLSKEKNQLFSLKLLKKLTEINLKAQLIFLGEGSMRDELKKTATEWGICSNVIFAGQRTDLESYYNAMDVFLMPSLYEGLPVAAIEAQCAGLPVLMSDRITTEANVGSAEFLGIDNTDEWIQKIKGLGGSRSGRELGEELVVKNGYAAAIEAKKWESLYR